MGEAQTPRLAPSERRALLVAAAQEIFAERGYTRTGLAEVAARAGVSKTLLYHYFPEGRPELYRLVMERLVSEVVEAVGRAAADPDSPTQRMDRLVAAFVAYFTDHPDAYRLLITEPWGSGDASVIGQAMAIRSRLAREVEALLAPAGEPRPVTIAGGAAALGAVLHVCELQMTDEVAGEDATDVAQRFVRGGLAALDLL